LSLVKNGHLLDLSVSFTSKWFQILRDDAVTQSPVAAFNLWSSGFFTAGESGCQTLAAPENGTQKGLWQCDVVGWFVGKKVGDLSLHFMATEGGGK